MALKSRRNIDLDETLWHNGGGDGDTTSADSSHHSRSQTDDSSSSSNAGGQTSSSGVTTSAIVVTSGSETFTTFTTFTAGSSTGIPTTTTTAPSVTIPLTFSYSSSVVTTYTVLPDSSAVPSGIGTSLPDSNLHADPQTVCAGSGIDTFATGVVATAILSSLVGLLLWLLFAFLRPRFRQLYAVREWFIAPGLRPRPLRGTPWAFLFPHTPLVPGLPADVADAGRSPADDARLFPANSALAQRTVWSAFLIALGWALLGLAGALPLYIVDVPCIAQTGARSRRNTGAYSTLQDLSVVRLLLFLAQGPDTSDGGTQKLVPRVEPDGPQAAANPKIETRLIVLTALVVVPAVVPALWKLLRELSRLVAFRDRWHNIHCGGAEIVWLSAHRAPGLVGWGEQRIKDFLVKNGLSESLSRSGSAQRDERRHQRDQTAVTADEERELPGVDVQGVFTITDTDSLARLIDERDIILNNLEVAETQYINSFAPSTPVQSLTEAKDTNSAGRRYHISRPRALMPYIRRREEKLDGQETPLPRNYVAPATFYRLRDMRGFGRMEPTISQRLVGSRFQEMHRESVDAMQALGAAVHIDSAGNLRAGVHETEVSFSLDEGPNHPDQPMTSQEMDGELERDELEHGGHTLTSDPGTSRSASPPEKQFATWGSLGAPQTPSPSPHTDGTVARHGKGIEAGDRETFPIRQDADTIPPHLRLQQDQPFVRPRSGLDHEHLGAIYANIGVWRSRLKGINSDIAAAQQQAFSEIAAGPAQAKAKGWLLVGRGVRFVHGVQVIEGRSKDDIRWDQLQRDDGSGKDIKFWAFVLLIALALGLGVTAATGLALADAPDVARFLPFFHPLSAHNNIGSGLATTLAPALAATLFVAIALALVQHAAQHSITPSHTTMQLNAFRASFFVLLAICGFWIVTVGSLVFSMESFERGTGESAMVANGTVYIGGFLLVLVVNAALVAPALMLLRPIKLLRTISRERRAITPRQHFRAIYPDAYNSTYATGCCVLAVVFAASFSLLFPLITPPILILLFLTLLANRFLIGYVYPNLNGSQNGGIIQIWFVRRLATLLGLQPLLLGLLFFAHDVWVLGAVLIGWAVFVVAFVETFAWLKLRQPTIHTLPAPTQTALAKLAHVISQGPARTTGDAASAVSTVRRVRTRGSMASVLDMLHATLAVPPSPARGRRPVPLASDVLDDALATERAARTHPAAPPRLPPLHADHAQETRSLLYAPPLLAPPPVIWLPNDAHGVARGEAHDLVRYHNLPATIDVRAAGDVSAPPPRRSTDM